jgi:hypothetical protein
MMRYYTRIKQFMELQYRLALMQRERKQDRRADQSSGGGGSRGKAL